MMAMRSFCRLAVSMSLRPRVRRIHMDTAQPHRDISEIFSDMISSGSHPSTEHINKFMSTIYLHKPKAVTLFNINYRSLAERSTIKGLRIGTNSWSPGPRKNVVLVSGLPLQDPSVIGVNLYVAAMLSRINPMLSCDVSVIPLANPKEYERIWRKMELASARSADGFLPASSILPPAPHLDPSKWITPSENVTLELRDTCKPLEVYFTRKNNVFVNIDVDLTAHGSTMQYKCDSLPNLSTKGKFSRFLSRLPQTPLPPSSPFAASLTPQVHGADPLLAPLLAAPSLVLELRSSHSLDDDQVVARGEEVIAMVKELLG